ncbi:hypothetical protein C8R47DRAFT_972484, partial [Mycena vitilis]
SVCQRLQRFVAGDTDTGNGGGVRNEAAFIQFVRICSSVRVFRLEAFTSLSDAAVLAIFQFCPQIEMVQLTGHDKSHGKVSGTALKTLARTPAWAPHLRALYLHDQTHKLDAGVKVLSQPGRRCGYSQGRHWETPCPLYVPSSLSYVTLTNIVQ